MAAVGYENAPIIQSISFISLIMSTALRPTGGVSLDLLKVLNGEVWRLFASQFVFQNTPQAIVGLIILYTCRQFERQMGSKKFAAFFIFSLIIWTILQVGIIVGAASVGLPITPSPGPYFLIYSLLAFFYFHIPKLQSSQFAILGMVLSEKSWTYLLAIQLLLSDGLSSFVAAFAGLLTGYMYDKDGFGLQRFRLPWVFEYIIVGFGKVFTSVLPLSGTPTEVNRRNAGNRDTQDRFNQAINNMNGGRREMLNEAFQREAFVEPPSEEAISNLMGLGFDREAVIQALRQTGNQVEAAANILLR